MDGWSRWTNWGIQSESFLCFVLLSLRGHWRAVVEVGANYDNFLVTWSVCSFIQMSESTTRVNFDKVFEAGVEWSGVCHQTKNHSLIAIP